MKIKMTLVIAMTGIIMGCGSDSSDNNKNADACASDNQCKGDRICVNQACVAPSSSSQCTPACGAGQVCSNGACVTETTSQCSPACGAGQMCSGGTCVNQTVETVPADFGQQCDTNDPKCEVACLEKDNSAVGFCSRTCATDPECPEAGYICEDVGNGASKYCVQGARVDKKPFAEACTSETDCVSGLCYGGPNAQIGYCTKQCEDFSECGDFWSCDLVDGAAFKICVQD